MHHSRRKSFDWYGLKQHFSIRKYHFGAASVLLGMSIALGTGTQVVQAAETVTTPESTSVASSTSATESTTSETSTETATSSSSERTVEIGYIVKYATEDGTLVNASVETVSVTTTETIAKATVSVTAVVPEGYELASGQSATVSQEVTENGVNIVTVKVVKKAEEKAATSETTTTASTETATAKSTEGAATTTATVSEAVKTPATVEEAKVVLEQVTSEAEVLANEGNRIVATDTTTDISALKAVAAATKLVATDATSVLQDTVATLDALNAQITAVRTSVEALALELRKYLGTDDIEIALNTSLSDLGVGQGTGVLVETGTTVTPSMDDANGAGIKTHTLRTGVAATSQAGWYTFESYDFYSYNANQPSVYINGTAIPAYIRYSLDSNANTSSILAELVSTTNGNVLETHTIEQGASVTLTYPQTVNPENETVTITYDTTLEIDGSTQGMLVLEGAKNGIVVDYNMMIVPDYQINTTRYVVEDGTVLATYSLQTIAGQPVTSSGEREFAGYTYKTTTKKVVQGGLPAGTVYMSGKVDQNTVHYKAIRKIISNDQVVTEYYFLDPTYTGPVDWNGTDTTGFIKLIETSPLVYTDGKTYDYNKSSTIYAPYTNDEESGYMVFKESPVNERGSKYRVVAQWSGTGEAGTYGRIFIGTQVYTTAQELGDFELKWRGVTDKFDNLGYVPFGIQQNLRNATIATAFETTHIYTPVPQEAIIRYQVEGATDYLEESATLTGNPGTDITYSTEDTINKYKKLGYELVSDGFTTTAGQTYDYDSAVKQEFLVVLKPRVVDVPKTAVPGEPVDPTDPSKGYVPPTPDETGKDTPIPYVQNGNVVINYVTEDGTVIKDPVNDETNVPAGTEYDTTDEGDKPAEIVKDGVRYVLVPSKTIGTETGKVEGGKTTEITYVYKKVANWIPQIPGVPEGQGPKVPYPFDPTTPDKPIDPTTPGTNGEVPSIPYVPGYTPVNPKTEEPLKPIDPTDPSKGYVPPTPDETGTDTPIPYVQNGNVVVKYVTEDGTVIKDPVNDETNVPAGTVYDTTDEGDKPAEIVTEDGSRYVLIPSKTVGSETGTVEGGKTTEITYVYKKVANWIPQIPGVPEGQEPKVPYPFDPENPDKPIDPTTPGTNGEVPSIPYVPGYTPVDPKTNEPLKPVDPTDPSKGYVPPTPDETGVDTPIPYVQNGNVVVNYVDENGNVLKTPVNDETDAPAGKSYDTTDNKPVEIVTEDGTTYELVRVEGSETGTVVGGKTTEVTYVYRKVETPAKKVVTNHVDEDGNPIAPQEEGTTPNKSIPGYEFTGKTVTDPDGNTTHIYRKVTKVVTNHVDEDGNPIAPQEEGTTPNKSIPGYEFTGKTVTDPDGNTTHIYRKVTKVVTNHVDEDGNPIAPQEEGTTPNKSIPGYEFTGKTVTDPDGNTTHIYRKVSKPVAPKPQAPVAPTTAKAGAAQLPNTGEASSSATVLGAGMLIAALALAGKRRRNED